MPQAARRAGVYVGNSDAEQAARLFKDGNDNYMWQERFQAGQPPLLNGHRWYTNDGFASGSLDESSEYTVGKPLFFGDFRKGYMIADRRQIGVTRLAERYADEGKVGLLFRHRVGGGVIRPKALAFYQV